MKTKTLALTFVLALTISSMVIVQTVKAQGLSIDLEFVWSPPAYVNQPFEIAATVSGGTPPYTYQWYTKWFPPWKPGMDPEQYRASSGSEIAVPGATSATFWFTPTVEGIYWISVGVSDSAGQSVSRFPSIQPFQLIVQNPQPLNLTIKPDGSVEPSTNLLERNGTTYTFKGDIFGTIWVQTNNIIIDGAGYTLRGNGINTGQNSEIGILLGGPDLSHRICRGVLVENLRLYNIPRGIYSVGGSNNSFIGNYFDKSSIEIQGNANSTGDLIKHNILINASVSFDYNPNGTDIITENNFVNSAIFLWLANAPVVDRNYWSNYTAKYPNATELDSSGIWDTPYVYGTFQRINSSIDYRPLVNPVTDFEIPNFNIPLPSATPTSTQHPTINTDPEPPKTEPFPTTIVAAVSGAIAVAVVAGLLVYFKKRQGG